MTDEPKPGRQEDLSARIGALENAITWLHEKPGAAMESIRRIANSMRMARGVYSRPEIAEAVRALEAAGEAEIPTRATDLLLLLRRIAFGPETGKLTILIIDDDPVTAYIIQRKLSATNREIFLAQTIAAAERILADKDISLIILDLLLPEGDGRDLLIRLRENPRTTSVPIFVVSGLTEAHTKTECFALGADVYFEKPIDMEMLAVAVAAKLQHVAARSAQVTEEQSSEFRTKTFLDKEGSTVLVQQKAPKIDLYKEAEVFVLDSIRQADQDHLLDLEKGIDLVKQMNNSIAAAPDLLRAATDRSQVFSVRAHSVNVTVLALRIGQILENSLDDQVKLGLAALLHEIGVVKLPDWWIHELEKWTRVEMETMRQWPIDSAQILRKLGAQYPWLSQITGQVYERENGTGFPLGLISTDIREEAKIIGIAEIFEASIHDRPFRKALTGYQSLVELNNDPTGNFSHRILKALLRSVSLYPYNEYVKLNTGEVAKVVEINQHNMLRPLVSVVYSSEGKTLDEPRLADLSQLPSVYITESITADNLPKT